MKVLAFVHPETGTTAVVHPVQSNRGRDETEAQFLARVASRAVPDGVAFQIVDHAPILDGDRTFRNALKCEGGAFSHDMAACRTMHMGRIRAARDAKLAALDAETIKALVSGDTARRDEIEAQKQVLRDLPQTFDLSSASTPDELKVLWPAELT